MSLRGKGSIPVPGAKGRCMFCHGNSLDLRNGGVALYLENFSRLNCTLAVLFSALKIDSSLLPSLVPSLK